MSIWFSDSLAYLGKKPTLGKERHFGNHSVVKRLNGIGETETVFKFYGSDIAVVNECKETIVVNDFGYTRGYTPRSINEIVRYYEPEDYTIVKGRYCEKDYDYWFNEAKKYRIKIFDLDLSLYNHKFFSKEDWKPKPIISTVIDVDQEIPKKVFRNEYFDRLSINNGLRLLNKKACLVLTHAGIGYIFCTEQFNSTGTVLFEPICRKIKRRKYVLIK